MFLKLGAIAPSYIQTYKLFLRERSVTEDYDIDNDCTANDDGKRKDRRVSEDGRREDREKRSDERTRYPCLLA